MKNFLVILSVFALACSAPRETKTAGGVVFELSPEILSQRTDTLIDLGTVGEGEVILYKARIRNVGADPLVITDVKSSCGCTAVDYEKQPIAPGAEGDFSFRFDSRGMWGSQLKLVEVRTSEGKYLVTVRAEVE